MIPFVIVVDGKGNIVYKHQGYVDGDEEELIERIKLIENGGAPPPAPP